MAAALRELGAVDRAVYEAVARTPAGNLDVPVRRLSDAANHSKLWLAIAAVVAVAGGHRGRRAALEGVVAIGVTSAAVNLGVKPIARRRRPDRLETAPFEERHVPMPASRSFPPAMPPRRSPSPTQSAATCPSWPCRSACWPRPSPTPGSTPASTTPATWSSGR
jgi:hypothetical protein